jgi:hypothetical protein
MEGANEDALEPVKRWQTDWTHGEGHTHIIGVSRRLKPQNHLPPLERIYLPLHQSHINISDGFFQDAFFFQQT